MQDNRKIINIYLTFVLFYGYTAMAVFRLNSAYIDVWFGMLNQLL